MIQAVATSQVVASHYVLNSGWNFVGNVADQDVLDEDRDKAISH